MISEREVVRSESYANRQQPTTNDALVLSTFRNEKYE